jgi:predicted enzyme related to lactoylglutathione lyase
MAGDPMNHHLSHFEIVASNAARSLAFYTQLFDWHINADNPLGYPVIQSGHPPVTGGIIATHSKPTVGLYVSSADLRRDLLRAEALSAEVLMPVTHIYGVDLTRFRCPDGHELGLWSLPSAAPFAEDTKMQGELLGFEIAGGRLDLTGHFIEALFGWEIRPESGEVMTGDPSIVGRLLHEDHPRTSIVVAVNSLAEHRERVRALGCRPTGPDGTWIDGRPMARFSDPDGNVVVAVER